MSRRRSGDAFPPDAGLAADLVDDPEGRVALYVTAREAAGRPADLGGADPVTLLALCEDAAADPYAAARVRRLARLADALCRFFNTQGTPRELVDLVAAFAALPRPDVLPGYVLIDDATDDDGDPVHLFARPGKVDRIEWCPGYYARRLSADPAPPPPQPPVPPGPGVPPDDR